MLKVVNDHLSGIRSERDATIQHAVTAGGIQGDATAVSAILGSVWDALLHRASTTLAEAAVAA
eukprot:8200752-Alexandrium_andersonii.AAC.1